MRKPRFHEFWPLALFPGFKLLLQLLTIPGYGIFRDEFYYIACSERLAWGYVDHPPLSIFLLRLVREVLGDSVWTLRLVPALVGAATVFLVGLIARRLGGGQLAQALAMAAFITIPGLLFVHHYYSMNALDIFFWAAAAYVLTSLFGDKDQSDTRWWLGLGVILGFGLLNKISVLWFGFGLGVGLVLTEHRRTLKTPGPWLAAGVAFALFLPHLIWQIRLDWPTLEFIANASGQKMVEVTPRAFVLGQLNYLGVITASLALLGLGVLMFAVDARRFRLLGWIYIAVFLVLMTSGSSRSGYLAPAYTWLLAAGGLGFERLVALIPLPKLRPLMVALAFVLVVGRGVMAAPFGLPMLPIDTYVAYARTLGVVPGTNERKELSELPQHFADMFGWREKAAAARLAVERLPPAEREKACLFAFNYGVAGALEHLGGDDLPPVLSGHNNFYLWGPGECTGEVVIVMGGDAERHAERFESVEYVTTVECERCMPYENNQSVFIGRGPRDELSEVWNQLKHYD